MNDKSTTPADAPGQEDASQAAPESSAGTGLEEAAQPTKKDSDEQDAQPEASSDEAVADGDSNASEADASTETGQAASGAANSATKSAPAKVARRTIDTEVRQYSRSDLTRAEQTLLDELAAGEKVRLLLPTSTKLDTGNWLMRGKVWAACTDDRLLLLAAGRRPHSEAVAFAQLYESLYNHVTGQLVLAPAPKTQVRGLSLTASAAKSLLARFQTKSQSND